MSAAEKSAISVSLVACVKGREMLRNSSRGSRTVFACHHLWSAPNWSGEWEGFTREQVDGLETGGMAS
eukprot:2039570-Prymnesium_polylepis.1